MSKSGMLPELPSADAGTHIPRSPQLLSPGRYSYRGWRIDHDPPPIPYRGADWQFVHRDYDLDDPRHGSAASLDAACAEIDNYETHGEF